MNSTRQRLKNFRRVPTREKFGYGLGHVYNDMVTAFLLSFIAVYVKVGLKLDVLYAGYVLFVFLISDAATRPIIILLSSRFNFCCHVGKRKTLHIIGAVLMTTSLVLSFSTLFVDSADQIVRFMVYVPIFMLLAVSFTCVQVAHKAVLRGMTSMTSERIYISMWRTMSSLAANILVFIVASIFLAVQGNTESATFTNGDEIIFQNLSYFIIACGITCCLTFYVLVAEQPKRCVWFCISCSCKCKRQHETRRKSESLSNSSRSKEMTNNLQVDNVKNMRIKNLQRNSVSGDAIERNKQQNIPKIIVTSSRDADPSKIRPATKDGDSTPVERKNSNANLNKTPVSNNKKNPFDQKSLNTLVSQRGPNKSTNLSSSKSSSETGISQTPEPSGNMTVRFKSLGKITQFFSRKKTSTVSRSRVQPSASNPDTSIEKEKITPLQISTISKLRTMFRRKSVPNSKVSSGIPSSYVSTQKQSTNTKTKAEATDRVNKDKKQAGQQLKTMKPAKPKIGTLGKIFMVLHPPMPNANTQTAGTNSYNTSTTNAGQSGAQNIQNSRNQLYNSQMVPPPATYRKLSVTSVHSRHGVKKAKAWYKTMCKKPKFFKTAVIHACSRLALVISQVYMPLYLTETLLMDKVAIALIPLIIYVTGFSISIVMRRISIKYGRKRTYAIGEAATLAGAVWLFLIHEGISYQVYIAAVLLGIGLSTMQVRSASMVTDLTGSPVDTGASFFSVNEKVIQAIAILLLQIFNPCSTSSREACNNFYRNVMLSMTGGSTFLGFAVITLAKVVGIETEEGNGPSLELTEDGAGVSGGL